MYEEKKKKRRKKKKKKRRREKISLFWFYPVAQCLIRPTVARYL